MEFEFGIVGNESYLSSLASDLPMRAVEMESQRQCDIGACGSELLCKFQDFLHDLAFELRPGEVDYQARLEIINNLTSAIDNTKNWQGSKLNTFGSFEYDFFSRWADLDLSLELSNRYAFEQISKREKLKVLQSFLNDVIRRGLGRNAILVANARVPIVSFQDMQHNISCDVSVENDAAVLKSRLLRWIGMIDARCRDLIFLVKFWAKAHRINDPKAGTLNSFALCLLVIFHLQTRSPPILPPLNAILDEDVARKLLGARNCVDKVLDDCLEKIKPFIIQKFGDQNKSTVAELFKSFFNQFSVVTEFWRQGLAVCTFTGEWGDRDSTCAEWRSKEFAMTVEDPFDRAENCARSVQDAESSIIFKAFESSADKLYNPSLDCDLPGLLDAIFCWPLDIQPLGLQHWLSQIHSKTTVCRVKRNPFEIIRAVKLTSNSKYSKNAHKGKPKELVPFVENPIEEDFRGCLQLDNNGEGKVEAKNETRTGKKKVVPLTNKEGNSAEVKNVVTNPIEEKFSPSSQLDNNGEAKIELQKKARRLKGKVLPLPNEDGNSAQVKKRVHAKRELHILKKKLSEEIHKNEILENKVFTKEQELEKLMKGKMELEDTNLIHELDITGLRVANEALKNMVNVVTKDLEELNSDLKELAEENIDLISKLKLEKYKVKAQEITISKLENTVIELETVVSQLEMKITNEKNQNGKERVERMRAISKGRKNTLRDCEYPYERKVASNQTICDDLDTGSERETLSLHKHNSTCKAIEMSKMENGVQKEEIQCFQQQTFGFLNEAESLKVENVGTKERSKPDVNEANKFPVLVSAQKLRREVQDKNITALKGKWCIQMPLQDGRLSPKLPGAHINKQGTAFLESSKAQPRLVTHREFKEASHVSKTLTHRESTEGSYLAKTFPFLDGKTDWAGGPSINKQKKESIVKPMSSLSTKTDKAGHKVIYKQRRVVNLDCTNEQRRSN